MVPKFAIGNTTIIIGLCTFRIDFDGPVEILDGSPVIAKFVISDTTVVISLRIFGVDLDGPSKSAIACL